MMIRVCKCWLFFGLGILCWATGGACGPPEGESSGRISTHESTKAERKSGQMHTADLAGACDEVAMALAADLNRLAEEEFANYRITMIFGDLDNKSGTMPTADFEYVRERIKNKLINSRTFRDNVKFVEKRARIEDLNRQEFAEKEDVLQEGKSGGVEIKRDNPEYTFYLNGNTYGIHRGTTHLYYLSFKLHRATDTAEVFAKDYEVKYDTKH